MFPLLTQSWLGRWTELVLDAENVTWEQRKIPVMGNQEMVQFCQNWAATANQQTRTPWTERTTRSPSAPSCG